MTRRLCSGFSCSVAFSPWMRIPSASRGTCRGPPRRYRAGRDNRGGGAHLQGDEVLQKLDALQVLRVLLDVGAGEERLRRRGPGQELSVTPAGPGGKGEPPTFS